MGARVKMRPQVLSGEMLLLIAAQAEGAEVFTLPGDVVVQMAQLARRALAAAAPAEAPRPVAQATIDQERLALWDAARQTVRFFSDEQREALRRALG
jgi:hypothetical protein